LLKIKQCVLLLFLCYTALVADETRQQLFSHIEQKLVEQGFENVLIDQHSDELRIYFQNEVYRDDLAAVIHVIKVLQNNTVRLQNIQTVQLIPLTHRRALYSYQFAQFDLAALDQHDNTESFFENLKICKSVFDFPAAVAKNSSLWKFDILLHPQIAANIGNYDDRFKVRINLLPALAFSPWSGGRLFFQYRIPLVNEFGWQENEYRLYQSYWEQVYALPAGLYAQTHIGLLGKERWGVTAEVCRFFFNHTVLLGAKYDVTGAFYKQAQEWYYSQMNSNSYQFYLDYNIPSYNLLLGVSYNKFLMQDYGWQVEVSRFYREVKIGTYFGITDVDKFFGIVIKIPLNQWKTEPRKRVRITVPDYYTWGYQASSQVYTYAAPIQSGIVLGKQRSLRNRFPDTFAGYRLNNSARLFYKAKKIKEHEINQ